MSFRLYSENYNNEFELGDRVSFMHEGCRLWGKVVRVYNTRTCYHVEVDGDRYFVTLDDDMRVE